jgi:hypothetical protein
MPPRQAERGRSDATGAGDHPRRTHAVHLGHLGTSARAYDDEIAWRGHDVPTLCRVAAPPDACGFDGLAPAVNWHVYIRNGPGDIAACGCLILPVGLADRDDATTTVCPYNSGTESRPRNIDSRREG